MLASPRGHIGWESQQTKDSSSSVTSQCSPSIAIRNNENKLPARDTTKNEKRNFGHPSLPPCLVERSSIPPSCLHSKYEATSSEFSQRLGAGHFLSGPAGFLRYSGGGKSI